MTAPAPAGRVPARRVVYVVDRFPIRSQTFVSQEWEGPRARDPRTQMISLRRAAPGEADARARYVGSHRLAVPGAHLAWLVRSPRGYARYLRFTARCGRRHASWLLMAPLVARWSGRDGVLHTHFAHRAALVTRAIAEYAPVRRSLVMHAVDIFRADSLLATRCEGAALATISEDNRGYLAAEHGLGDVALVPCGVSDPGGAALWSLQAAKRYDVMAVGRLVEKKGLHVLLDALGACAARGRPLRLLVVGEGPEAGRLQARATALGISERVTFAGSWEHTAVLDAMLDARVLVVPSVVAADGDRDGIPVVLMEAMVRGVPVVASRISGVTEVLDEDCGWLVPPGSAEALADAVGRALDDAGGAAGRGRWARQRILRTHLLEHQVDAAVVLADSASPRATGADTHHRPTRPTL